MTRPLTALALVASLALNVAAYASLVESRTSARATVLRGEGCDGASGTLYAMQEDDLPYCHAIKRVQLASMGARP